MNHQRDMQGYQQQGIDPKWPNNAKLAVQFVINYEEGGESCILNGDDYSEAYLSELVGIQPLKQARHLGIESLYEYGSRAGFWRLYRLFTQYNVPVTVFAVTHALQQNPDVIQAMQQANWEIACHGLRWIDYKQLDEPQEKHHIQQAITLHKALTGAEPQGWYTGRASEQTRKLIAKLLAPAYDSDSYADDLPFWNYDHSQPQLIIPYALDTNDMRFCSPQGFNAGEQFYQYLKDAFDYLYQEAVKDNHAAKMLNIGLHGRISGRPARAAALARFLEYVNGFDDIWITRRIDIAQHWRKVHPPSTN